MRKIKIETLMKRIWNKSHVIIPNDIDQIILNLNIIKDKNLPSCGSVVWRLRKERKGFMKDSYTSYGVKKNLSLKDSDLKEIKLTKKFGLSRYLKSDLAAYLEVQLQQSKFSFK